MDLEHAVGERREMIDRLLGKAAELLGDGRCGFRSCYGQSEAMLSLSMEGDKGRADVDFGVCEDHMLIVELAETHAPDDAALAGFFVTHLDDRFDVLAEAEATP